MKKTMNILEFYEFLKEQDGMTYDAMMNGGIKKRHYIENNGLIYNTDGFCRLSSTFTVDMPDFMPNWDNMKEVEYFGKKLLVPKDTKWLAVDANGNLYSYNDENAPSVRSDCFSVDNVYFCIAVIDYVGDWTKSLVEV